MDKQELDDLAQKVAELIITAVHPVVFTGAGISTESGIPDFRSPGGIWERFNPDDFTYQKFVQDPEARKKHWQMLRGGGLLTEAQPNQAHYAIADLYTMGKLDCVITQNIDNLHQKAGVPDDMVFELHGNMQWAVCLSCGQRLPLEQLTVRFDAGEEAPDCEICHGLLKPSAVFFGESLPAIVLEEAAKRAHNSDLFIVIGSTLTVFPAAYMPIYAVESGEKLVIINLSPTPMDRQAAIVINARAGEAMTEIVARIKEQSRV